MKPVEEIIAPNGKLWSEKKPKTSRVKRGKSSQQTRRAETLKWRADRKAQLWELRPYLGAICGLCEKPIYGFKECELDHKRCLGTRGDGDTEENTHLVHAFGNRAKGSMSLEAYLAKYSLAERQAICKGEPCPKRERP